MVEIHKIKTSACEMYGWSAVLRIAVEASRA